MSTVMIVRMVHFLAILSFTAVLAVQNALLKPTLSRRELRRLTVLDAVYGLSAVLVFGAGHALWFMVGKPAEFYTKNPVFHVKLTLFVVVFLLSIVSTVFFLKRWRSGAETVVVPARVRVLKRVEFGLLLLIPVLAVIMAAGVGLVH